MKNKLYSDHLESLQVMEKNYASMSRELEKLEQNLQKLLMLIKKSSEPYGGILGNNENEASGLPLGQNAYDHGMCTRPQSRWWQCYYNCGWNSTVPASVSTGYNAPRAPVYDASSGSSYDAQRSTSYDVVIGSAYNAHRVAIFYAHRTTGYNPPKSRSGSDPHKGGQGYDASRAVNYDAQSRGAAGPHGHAPPVNSTAYGSITPPARGRG
ncbi:hypothetical protein Lalb_Chr21g0318031 [Lupinus albus]|uniref:Uncharacterized protein n=1 Tax=Lupinus albus TaxID=3870 RepID=A0A6A4NUJ9_LUPAL|nr:hypothetical protein Lalb_Chr21g0318031 [Lupinus albus]